MADEFFDELPIGPVAPSKRYFSRLQRAVEQSLRLVTAPTYPGNAGTDAVGPWLAPEFDEIVWALITASPQGPYSGHSFQQRLPDTTGSWTIPDPMLQGDNGSQAFAVEATITEAELSSNIATFTTDEDPSGFNPGDRVGVTGVGEPYDGGWVILSTPSSTTFTVQIIWPDIGPVGLTGAAKVDSRPRSGPAFDPNGGTVPAGTIVALARGYLNVGADEWQWTIVNGGGAGSTLKRVQVTDDTPAGTVNGCDYYPGKLRTFDPSAEGGCAGADGADVWVTPAGCGDLEQDAEYLAERIPSVTVGDEQRPTYRAVQRVDCCNPGTTPDGYTRYTNQCSTTRVDTQCIDGVPKKVTTITHYPTPLIVDQKIEDADPTCLTPSGPNQVFATNADGVTGWYTVNWTFDCGDPPTATPNWS